MTVETVAAKQTPEPPRAKPQSASAQSAPPATATESAPRESQSSPSGNYAMRYDNQLARVFVEARDPVTGRVIMQFPPEQVAEAFRSAAHPQVNVNTLSVKA